MCFQYVPTISIRRCMMPVTFVKMNGLRKYSHDLNMFLTSTRLVLYIIRLAVWTFRTGKQLPNKFKPIDSDELDGCIKRLRYGRPEDESRAAAFEQVVVHLENHYNEQITVNELCRQMTHVAPSGTPYSSKYMKFCLQHRLGDRIIIAEQEGKSDIITFQNSAHMLLHDFFKNPRTGDIEQEIRTPHYWNGSQNYQSWGKWTQSRK